MVSAEMRSRDGNIFEMCLQSRLFTPEIDRSATGIRHLMRLSRLHGNQIFVRHLDLLIGTTVGYPIIAIVYQPDRPYLQY